MTHDQGKPDSTPVAWKHRDGQNYHTIIQGAAENRFFDLDGYSRIDTEFEVQRKGPTGEILGTGRIDLLIDERHVLDFKTDQRTGWTVATARARGEEYASRMNEYLRSPQLKGEPQGHLYMVGRPSSNPAVESAFSKAAESRGVTVTFCRSGDPNQVLTQIENRFLRKDRTTAQRLTETIETRRLAPSSSGIQQKLRMDQVKGLRFVKESQAKFFGKMSCEVLVECKPYPGPLSSQPGQNPSLVMVLAFSTVYAHKRYKNSAFPEKLQGLRDQIRQRWNQQVSEGKLVMQPVRSKSWVKSTSEKLAPRPTAKRPLQSKEILAVKKTNRTRVARTDPPRRSPPTARQVSAMVPKPVTPRRTPPVKTPVKVQPIKTAPPPARIPPVPRSRAIRPAVRNQGGGRKR